MNRLGDKVAALLGEHTVVESGDDRIMPDKAAVTYINTTLILKLAACIYKYSLAYVCIYAAVGVKRRKESEALIKLLPDKLPHEPSQLRRLVVAAVDIRCKTQSSLTELMHFKMHLTAALGLSGSVHGFDKFPVCHN